MFKQSYSIDPLAIISKYYNVGSELFQLLVKHSQKVAELALNIATKRKDLNIDLNFVYEAAMLHDIGILKTNAPSIHCHGSEPYIKHGIIGAEILRSHNLPHHALVAERHTSSGLTHEEIIAEGLPLPLNRSYLPESIEEKLICYADCFYSKTKPDIKKSVDSIRESMIRDWKKYALAGEALNAKRFDDLHNLFINTI